MEGKIGSFRYYTVIVRLLLLHEKFPSRHFAMLTGRTKLHKTPIFRRTDNPSKDNDNVIVFGHRLQRSAIIARFPLYSPVKIY